MDIVASNLSYSINGAHVLSDISFTLGKGQLMAIMSASGGGKTTLMSLLTGRTDELPLPHVGESRGQVSLDGRTFNVNDTALRTFLERQTGFVTQFDLMLEVLTPRELLRFRAELALPGSYSKQQREERVEHVLESLNLQACADIKIGTPGLNKGISGGQRKRLNIALTLLESPRLLLLDECTSGLDNATALGLIRNLSKLAVQDGITILMSIHQPSSLMFQYFDQLLLLAKGKPMYFGKEAVSHFAALGYKMPAGSNPAEFVISVLESPICLVENDAENRDLSTDEIAVITGDKDNNITTLPERHDFLFARLPSAAAAQLPSAAPSDVIVSASVTTSSPGEESLARPNSRRRFATLTRRTLLTTLREPLAASMRLSASTFLFLVIGFMFWRMELNQGGILDRFGMVFITLSFAFFDPLFATCSIIPKEGIVFRKESSDSLYNPLEYLMSKFILQVILEACIAMFETQLLYWMSGLQAAADKYFIFVLCFYGCQFFGATLGILLSCISNSVEAAVASSTSVGMLSILFTNFLVKVENIPIVLRWICSINPMNYALNVAMANEYSGLTFDCKANELAVAPGGQSYCPITSGSEAKQFMKIDASQSFGAQFAIVYGIGIAFIVLAATALSAQKIAAWKARTLKKLRLNSKSH